MTSYHFTSKCLELFCIQTSHHTKTYHINKPFISFSQSNACKSHTTALKSHSIPLKLHTLEHNIVKDLQACCLHSIIRSSSFSIFLRLRSHKHFVVRGFALTIPNVATTVKNRHTKIRRRVENLRHR